MKLSEKLRQLSIDIPSNQSVKFGNYLPFLKNGNNIYISGQLPINKGNIIIGKVPTDISLEQANQAAKICMINTLLVLNSINPDININSLNCLQLSGFVNAENSFVRHPEVINGASDFICDVLGEKGKHTRIAVGCNSLPKNACVEISSIFSLSD
jgi:enamine deaminase RidA (YjgF/YER057c/UK114 family)